MSRTACRHGGAALGVEPRESVAEKRPREEHVALLVAGDQPQDLARDLVPALLQMAQAEIQVELVVERAERGHHRLDRHVGIERHLGERMIAGARDGLARIGLVAAEPLGEAGSRPRGAWPPPRGGRTGRAWRPCRRRRTRGRTGSAARCSRPARGRCPRRGGSTPGARPPAPSAGIRRRVEAAPTRCPSPDSSGSALAWLYSSRSAGLSGAKRSGKRRSTKRFSCAWYPRSSRRSSRHAVVAHASASEIGGLELGRCRAGPPRRLPAPRCPSPARRRGPRCAAPCARSAPRAASWCPRRGARASSRMISWTTSGASPSDGSSHSSRRGPAHERAADREHLLLAARQRARELARAAGAAPGTA